jgi:hypothetical protein
MPGGAVPARPQLILEKEPLMTTTFKKRQKEMKRMEKARMKAERRAQKKLEPRVEGDEIATSNEAFHLSLPGDATDVELGLDPGTRLSKS